MSKQYVDVTGWEDSAPTKQYVDVSGWEDAPSAAPKESKSFLRRVVDGVSAPFKAVVKAYAEDQKPDAVQPISAQEKLDRAKIQYEMGRRSKAYIDKLETEVAAEKLKQRNAEMKVKREAQIEESKKPAMQQLSDQFNPRRPVASLFAMVPALMGNEKTAKAIQKELGGDYQYDAASMDETFAKANPEYVTAEQFIVDPSWGAKAGVGAAITRLNRMNKGAEKIHQASSDILKTTSENLGIELPKATTEQDDMIAQAAAQPYKKAEDAAPAVSESVAADINVGHKDIEAKAAADAEREARVAKAHEEAMARKEQLEAGQNPPADSTVQKPIIEKPDIAEPAPEAVVKDDAAAGSDIDVVTKTDEPTIPTFEELSTHPRYAELLDMRRNVTAKAAEKKAVRESDRAILHQNTGKGYETSVIPERDVRNYDYDFEITKGDVAKIEAGKVTPQIEEKLRRDLDRLDNDPMYAKVDEPASAPKSDSLKAKFAHTFGNDAAGYTMKMIDRFAKSKGMDAEEWIAKSGIDFEDMTYTTYGRFKKDMEEADKLFQAAYHGTPHTVDKFTTAKIGTGEGNQAYGHGLYFAEDKATGEWYRKKLSNPDLLIDGVPANEYRIQRNNPIFSHIDIYQNDGMNKEQILSKLEDARVGEMERGNKYFTDAQYQEAINVIRNAKKLDREVAGNIYKVELKPKQEEMIHWDKPLSEQSDYVKNALAKEQELYRSSDGELGAYINENHGEGIYKEFVWKYGSQEKASERLHELGIKGIQYLDGQSRPKAEGFHNFVIFNDHDVDIIGHNGKMLNGLADEFFQNEAFVKGMVSFGFNTKGEMTSVIRAFESADISTLVHETAHVFERTLDDAQRAVYNGVFGHIDDATARSEAFAEGFVKWLSEGKAVDGMDDVFESFKIWLRDLWDMVRGTNEERFALNNEMRVFYRALMGDEEAAAKLFTMERAEAVSMKEAEELFQQQKSAGGFYSVAQRAIEGMPNRMNVSAFRNYLKGKGVKNDEMVYGGIEDALNGKEVVTKEEMIAALKNPEMEKVTMGSKEIPIPEYGIEYLNSMDKPERDLAYRMMTIENRSRLTDGTFDKEWDTLISKYPNLDHNVIHDASDDMINMARASDAETKYQNYSLRGIGTNYREELTKMATEDDFKNWAEKYRHQDDPTWEQIKSNPEMYREYHEAFKAEEPTKYRSSHWDEPNVLYHVRKQDTTIDGEKTLLIEEIQSDWHQAGRKQGYQGQSYTKEYDAAKADVEKLYAKYGVEFNGRVTDRNYNKLVEAGLELDEEQIVQRFDNMVIDQSNNPHGIPNAPYTKNWHEKALKDQIQEAAEKGYDRVAWVNGKTSADRYSLSQSVDRLVYNKDMGMIQGYKDGSEVMTKRATDDELEALIGKEPAKKLMDGEVRPGIYEIKGEALDIGGDGMKGFYDKILPDFARKYVKKWGAEVEKKTLSNGTEVWSFPVTQKMKEDVAYNGQPLYAHGTGAVAGVGEDEEGNLTFDPTMALLGAAGVSMVASKTVRHAVSKVAAKAEKMSDAAARNLVIATVKAADTVTAKSITKLSNAIKESSIVDYVVGHKIYRMKDYMKMREQALRASNAGMEEAARLHLQLKELSSEAREAMYGYMSGDKNVALTPALKEAADTFIARIDEMGQKMVDEGFLSKEAYEEWKGQYLHRRYASKIKKVSDWASGKGEFAVDKIQMRGKTWKVGEEEYQDLLQSDQIGKVSDGKIEVLADNDGTYTLRRDWTAEERAAMGEIRDVAYSLPETMGRLAQMIEFGSFLKAVPSKYILEQAGRADKVMEQLGYTKLSGSRYGALNGKWVNSSIANDLKRVSNDVMGEEGNVQRLWSDYVTAMKLSHTVYNPTAHVNNLGSNVVLQTAAGLNPAKVIKYATDGAIAAKKFDTWKILDAKRVMGLSDDEAATLAKIESDADFQLYRELNDKHMFGRSQLNEMLRTYMAPQIDTKSGNALHRISETAKAAYQGEDNVMRFSAVKQLTKDGLWSETENGIDQVRMSVDEAMEYVNSKMVPDYSKPMSPLALKLRDSGLVPFMSWTYYSTPILVRQLKENPTRVLALAATWYGINQLFGVDPYNEESAPKGWGAQRLAIGKDGDKITGVRVSSMIPHVQLVNPANTFLEPLTSGVPQTLLGQATNYNFYFRKPITQKEGAEGAYQRVKDAVQNALPSPDVIDKAYNLAESKLLDKETRRRDRVFEPRTPAQEAAGFFVNLQTYDMSNNRDRARKDKIKDQKTETKWDRKVDKAIKKLERIFE